MLFEVHVDCINIRDTQGLMGLWEVRKESEILIWVLLWRSLGTSHKDVRKHGELHA